MKPSIQSFAAVASALVTLAAAATQNLTDAQIDNVRSRLADSAKLR